MYFSQTVLTGIVLQIVRAVVPGCVCVNLERAQGPYRYRNWKVLRVAAGPEEQAEAFAAATTVASARHWIMVPDGHFLHGQIVGQERGTQGCGMLR